MVGSANTGLGEEQDRGRDAGIGAKDARGQLDDGIELVLFDQHAPQVFVRLRRAEQHAVRDDHRRAPANLQEAKEQREEEQLGLFGFDDLLKVFRRRLEIQ